MKKLLISIKSHHNARILEAAKTGDSILLHRLLNESYKRKPMSRTLQQALSLAIDARSAICVRHLLEAGANPNVIKSTSTPVPIPIYVIKEESIDILQVLLDNGCKVNLKWMNNETSLHVAMRLRHDDAVRRLVAADADPTILNDHAESPLSMAVDTDNMSLLQLFLQHPKALGWVDPHGRTLLHLAARLGRVGLASYLLDRGLQVDAPSHTSGCTPLMEATLRGGPDMVHALATRGSIDLDMADMRGMTAVLLAAQGWLSESLSALLKAGANVNAQDNQGYTALIHAGPAIQITHLLLDNGIDTNLQNHFGMTALWFAAFHKYTQTTTLLLRSSSDPELKGSIEDEFHTSPLEIALKRGHYDISRRIIYSGCNTRNLARFMVNADIMPVFKNSTEGQALKAWIREWLREVKSLRYLSRLRIRQSLGRIRVTQKVAKLPLPQLLIDYVDLSEVECI